MPEFNLLAVLSIFGAIQGFLLGFGLLSLKQGNKTAHRLLAALILVVSIFIFGSVVRSVGYESLFPHLSRIHDPFPFLVGPLFFLYLTALITGSTRFPRKYFLHFIPFGICTLYLIPYYLQSAQTKFDTMLTTFEQGSMGAWYYVRSILVIIHVFIYLALSIWMIVLYLRKTKQTKGRLAGNILLRVRFLVVSIIVLWVAAVLRFVLDDSGRTNLLVPLGIGIMIYGLGYIHLRNPVVSPETNDTVAPKYEKSTLLPQRSDRYLKKLLELMETEKPYLDGELTLQKLADRLSIPAHHLSQTINEQLDQTFSDFVNVYRVEEVKRRLHDPAKKHNSILAIAEDAGFNTKSSFNSVFKKHTGITPSEYRKDVS